MKVDVSTRTNSVARCKEISASLARFPRFRLGHLPTPLEPLNRLSEALGGPRIWIKRNDCTGLAGGGNKVRKLGFLMAEAQEQGASHVVTHGTVQSNHVRQTAAAAKLGMACHVRLENRTGSEDWAYLQNGSVLLGHGEHRLPSRRGQRRAIHVSGAFQDFVETNTPHTEKDQTW